ARSGVFVVPSLTVERARRLHLDGGFRAEFPGHVYAQPLYWRGADAALLLIATEDDAVYALDTASGRALWRRSLGTPVALSTQPCGNIDPLGITGTPVIDAARQAIYVEAFVAQASGPRHLVFALSIKDGATLPGWPVDIGAALQALGQRFAPR